MDRSTIAAAITAVAFAVIVPFALAQTASGPEAAPPAAAARANPAGPGMMSGSVQAQAAYRPGAMSGYAQGQGGYGPGMMRDDELGWMNGYGGIWTLLLLVFGFVGLAAWIVKEKSR